MLLIVAGAGAVFQIPPVKLGIGLAGGAFLLFLGGQMLAAAPKADVVEKGPDGRHPFFTGMVLTAANPYFLIWWATVGLTLATDAVSLGVLAFVLFGVLHWLCDLIWLEILSLASFAGTEVLGKRMQQGVLIVCGTMLVGFGVMFLSDSLGGLFHHRMHQGGTSLTVGKGVVGPSTTSINGAPRQAIPTRAKRAAAPECDGSLTPVEYLRLAQFWLSEFDSAYFWSSCSFTDLATTWAACMANRTSSGLK